LPKKKKTPKKLLTNFGQDGKIKKLRKTEHITKSQKTLKKFQKSLDKGLAM